MAIKKGYLGDDGREYFTLEDLREANQAHLRKWFPRKGKGTPIAERLERLKTGIPIQLCGHDSRGDSTLKYLIPANRAYVKDRLPLTVRENPFILNKIKEPPRSLMFFKYDSREDLDRTVRDLKLTLPMLNQINFIRNPEEKARIAQKQFDRVSARIDAALRAYLDRINQGQKCGALDSQESFRATFDATGSFSPFEDLRKKARQAYREIL